MRLHHPPNWLLLALVVGLAAALGWATGPYGVGVSHDSIFYLHGAEHLARGQGYALAVNGHVQSITHYPVGYPAVLALGMQLGLSAEAAARWLNLLALLGVALGGAWAVRRWGGSRRAALATALLLGLQHQVLLAYGMAWSEPLFLLLLTALFWAYGRWAARPRWATVGLLAALAAALVLTRYAGILALGVAALGMVLNPHAGARARRLAQAGVFALLAAVPVLLWLLRNRALAGNATNRTLDWHGLPWEYGLAMFEFLRHWLVPGPNLPQAALWPILAGLGGLILYWVGRRLLHHPKPEALLRLAFGALYPAFVLAMLALVDPGIPIDGRMMLPAWVALVPLAAWAWPGKVRLANGRHLLPLVLGLALVVLNVRGGVKRLGRLHKQGEGYTTARYTNHPAIRAASALPDSLQRVGPGYNYLYVHYLLNQPVYATWGPWREGFDHSRPFVLVSLEPMDDGGIAGTEAFGGNWARRTVHLPNHVVQLPAPFPGNPAGPAGRGQPSTAQPK